MFKYITAQTASKLFHAGFGKYVGRSCQLDEAEDKFYLNTIGLECDLNDYDVVFWKNRIQRCRIEIQNIKAWIVENPNSNIVDAKRQINTLRQEIYRHNKKVARFNKVFETAIAFHNIESEIPTVDIYA
jgi:hypothetical protein